MHGASGPGCIGEALRHSDAPGDSVAGAPLARSMGVARYGPALPELALEPQTSQLLLLHIVKNVLFLAV
jgi:hypothetical protein